jgi:hypothetical protein
MKTFEVRFELSAPRSGFAFSGRNFIAAMQCYLAKDHGGTCHGEATDALLIAQIRARELEAFMPLAQAWAEAERRQAPNLKLLVVENPRCVLTRSQEEQAEANCVIPVKLTRKFFFNVAAGRFVASNVWHGGREAFTCWVAADSQARRDQWKSAVACGAAQRLCRVFQSEEHFQQWSSEMSRYFGLRPV